MTLTTAVVVASLACFALKLAGYLLPGGWLANPRVARVTAALPVALLAALIGKQTFATDTGHLAIDARLPAVLVALVALRLRANFILVVVAAAATAAGLRALGLS